MGDTDANESPIEKAAETAGPPAVEAFKLVGNETRLAILLALWEAYDPYTQDNAVSFSELCDRIEVRDTGQFNYHLSRLVDRFVEKTAEGYEIRHSGLKIVKGVIRGAGLREETLQPFGIPGSCPLCDAPVEISYQDGHLYQTCTECRGIVPPQLRDELPPGTLTRVDFSPAGLTNRTPEEVFVAGTIELLGKAGSAAKGNCPECSGPIDQSLRICGDHEPSPTEVCPTCGTRDEVRVWYVCSVCKWWGLLPPHWAVHDHPAVVSFCYERGIETAAEIDDAAACGRLWNHVRERDHALASEDPVRVRITIRGNDDALHLTLDENLDVIDVIDVGGSDE